MCYRWNQHVMSIRNSVTIQYNAVKGTLEKNWENVFFCLKIWYCYNICSLTEIHTDIPCGENKKTMKLCIFKFSKKGKKKEEEEEENNLVQKKHFEIEPN